MTAVGSRTASTRAARRPHTTPEELAARLGQPAPTPEQSAAICAPLEPGVIVAGAGSGKTETMAARVVWLVANGLVRPEQVLGLTFTRKAARELAGRIRRRLGQLAAHGVVGDAGLLDGEPTVATYDSFAARIVTEHALRLGREPGARLITEAVAWQYATRVVEAYGGPMESVEYAPATVVNKVLALHGELAGHLVEPAELVDFARVLRQTVDALPRVSRMRGPYYADVRKALDVQDARAQLVPLVEAYRALKRQYETVDFADQAELAARLARDFPEIGAGERQRYRVVLLDEYQDTSHAQLVLLRALFGGGHPVTAVGDPCQSIYGWRGASAGTLTSFRREFATAARTPARQDSLTTSFRNGPTILTVANAIAEPLRAEGLDVPVLTPHTGVGNGPRTADGAGPAVSEVIAAMHRTADDEASDIARRARVFWNSSPTGRTIAVLVRNRSQIPRIDAALRGAGLPVEVVGVGGLLSTPEVADVVATLRVLADPARGDALMRLLTGSRWRLGPRDIDGLARWARRLAHHVGAATPAGATPGMDQAAGPTDAAEAEPDDVDERSIVDALDALPQSGSWFSPEGHRRLAALSQQLRALRKRVGQPLPDLVHDIERTLGFDVEVAARGDATGRANLDRFLDVAAEFAASGESPTLSAFLAYLEAAEEAERGLRPGEVEVAGDRVQVLTVHGAKGLEWDAVFVAGLVDQSFPAGHAEDRAWLGDPGELPYPLRGDVSSLPRLRLDGAADQREARDLVLQFAADSGAAGRLEERRLAYVAVTRARRLLVCTGYWWSDGVRPRKPSEFLVEIRAACEQGAGTVGVWAAEPAEGEPNPLDDVALEYRWPYDPLGARRAVIEEGADLVHAALAGDDAADLLAEAAIADAAAEWDADVDRLIAERERLTAGSEVEVPVPAHLSVSQLVQLRADPTELARSIRRPVPREPAPLARRGTLFHAWLEARWGAPRLLDTDELPGSADDGAVPDRELGALQEAFLASEWAARTPVEVEPPFELMVAGVLIRGRADAVFATSDGGLDVVDWKTGRPPVDLAQVRIRAVQLAAYRLAFATLRGVPLEKVGAAFHYVRENVTLRPVDLMDQSGLEELIRRVPSAS
ncbi:MAG TPA: ATP-dependent DNA helicase [Jiangellales bacterium]|nr:ATP-dependent DNA helicase [Jiangellales bacterium]